MIVAQETHIIPCLKEYIINKYLKKKNSQTHINLSNWRMHGHHTFGHFWKHSILEHVTILLDMAVPVSHRHPSELGKLSFFEWHLQ